MIELFPLMFIGAVIIGILLANKEEKQELTLEDFNIGITVERNNRSLAEPTIDILSKCGYKKKDIKRAVELILDRHPDIDSVGEAVKQSIKELKSVQTFNIR